MYVYIYTTGFPGGSAVKNLLSVQETKVHSLGQEDPLGKEMQPPPVFLLGNLTDRGALPATDHVAAKSWTQLSS